MRQLFVVLPRFGLERGLRVAECLGDVLFHLLAKQRRRAHAQLVRALPELRDPDAVLREMFRAHTRSIVEMICIDEIAARLDSYVTIEHLEWIDQALAQGRGCVIFTGHLGNWELLAATFGLRGYPVTVVARPVKGGGRLNAENLALRARSKVETLLRDDAGAMRRLLGALRRGRLLALLVDQSSKRGQRIWVEFFGRPAPTPIGAALLAFHTGAPLLGAFIERRAGGGHHVRIVRPQLSPRPLGGRGDRDAWVAETTQRITSVIEQQIRARPQEWVWWHRRWRDPTRRREDDPEA